MRGLELWSLVGFSSFTGTGGPGCFTMGLIVGDSEHIVSRLDAHASRLMGHPFSWCQMV